MGRNKNKEISAALFKKIEPLLPAFEPSDKGYDYPRCRAHLKSRGIKDRIARKGIERNDRLGRHR